MLHLFLRIQAVFYVLTGIWSLVSISTFQLVTGPKTDLWLVHMVGLLATIIGVVLWIGSRKQPELSVVLLSLLAAASFAAIDLRYALPGQISPVYLADAAAELAIIIVVCVSWFRRPAVE